MKRSKRREIARDTLKILEAGEYKNKAGKTISIAAQQKAAEKNTRLFRPEELLELIQKDPAPPRNQATLFAVNPLSTLDSVRQEYTADPKVICLNFASARNPGGGFLNGSQAQEESIARATGLYPCLLKGEGYYVANRAIETCLYTDHMIYAPGVPLLKDEKGELLEEAVNCSILTAPAVNTGVVLRNEPDHIPQIEPRMSRRIEMVLAVCAELQYETLILGAWGCGVFRNDPEVIAQMFHQHLHGKFKNQFKKVVFSIYAREERFIQPFQKYFGEPNHS